MRASVRIIGLISLLVGMTHWDVSAQESRPYQIAGGGFGHFFTGFSVCDMSNLENYLSDDKRLGSGVELGPTGRISGGQGFGLIGRRFMIGGEGFGSTFAEGATIKGRATALLGGGSFQLGYMIKNGQVSYLYTFLGFGSAVLSLKIRNYSDEYIWFDTYEPLARRQFKEYTYVGTLYQAGMGWKRMIPFGSKAGSDVGGMILGADMGVTYLDGVEGWKRVMYGPPRLYPVQLFIRMTVGGGGISFQKNKS